MSLNYICLRIVVGVVGVSVITREKERILDTIVTLSGKNKMGYGERFNPKFISYSDSMSFYDHEEQKGVAGDATQRLYFESISKIEDSILYETNDQGKVLGFKPSENEIFGENGGIIQVDTTGLWNPVTGSNFSSLAVGLSTGSLENLDNLDVIGSVPGKTKNRNRYEGKD